MLDQIFLKVLEMSLSASIVIMLVILIRLVLKRFPKSISYMLWSVVLFRMFCPVAIRFELSPIPDMEAMMHEWVYGDEGHTVLISLSGNDVSGNQIEGIQSGGAQIITTAEGASDILAAQGQRIRNEMPDFLRSSRKAFFFIIGKNVWLIGVLLLFGYCMVSLFRIRKRVETAIRYKENIYITEKISSPFVMGLFRPRIYLPMGLDEQEQEYVILHEQFHVRRFDYVVKLLGFAATCIHWFNPMAWIAFILLCNDMEMSCDEAVISRMGEEKRADYSTILLSVSTNRHFPSGIPVDFGEGNVKERIRNMQRYKKAQKSTLVVLTAGVAVVCLGLVSTRTMTHVTMIKEDEQESMTAALQEQEISVHLEQQTEESILEPYIKILSRLNEEWGTSYAFDPDKTYEEIVQFVSSMNEDEFEQYICELHELDLPDPLHGESNLYYGFP